MTNYTSKKRQHKNFHNHSNDINLFPYLWNAHVDCMTVFNALHTLSVTGDARDIGAQCLRLLKAERILLMNAANGGCCNNSIGGLSSSGCQDNKDIK